MQIHPPTFPPGDPAAPIPPCAHCHQSNVVRHVTRIGLDGKVIQITYVCRTCNRVW
jgi:hypothetical protein